MAAGQIYKRWFQNNIYLFLDRKSTNEFFCFYLSLEGVRAYDFDKETLFKKNKF